MTNEIRVSALLLCAGQSSRMDGENKLLMKFDSQSVLRRTSNQVCQARFHDVVAITGHERERITAELQAFDRIRIVHNPQFEVGMHGSIRAGLKTLDASADFFAVCLADQPLLTSRDYDFLISVAEAHPSALLIAPRYAGIRGTPTLISMRLKSEIEAHADSDRGAVYLFERYPDFTVYADMPSPRHSLDVDTQEMLHSAREVLNETN